jgi:hypothetical protein
MIEKIVLDARRQRLQIPAPEILHPGIRLRLREIPILHQDSMPLLLSF